MKKAISAVCIVILLAVQAAFSLTAASQEREDILSAAFGYFAKERGADSFLQGLSAGSSDRSAACYVRLYGRSGTDELLQSAKQRADELISSERFVPPTELQRTAVLLSALGDCPREVIDAAVYKNPDFDRQGFNAYIWGLIAANASGLEAEEGATYTRESLAESIIERQLADGGFALFGESSDADMTAFAIDALVPLKDNPDVSGAIDRAVKRLREMQQPSGAYLTMGVENCESTAQALVAFAAAGYGIEDENVAAAYGALLTFRREDGGFAHLADGKTNALATLQAIEALTALTLAERGELLFGEPKRENTPASESEDNSAAPEAPPADNIPETTDTLPENASNRGFGGVHIKLIISAVAGIGAVAACVFAAVQKQKRLLICAAVCGVISGGVWLLDLKTADEYYAQSGGGDLSVTLSVSCENALSNLDMIDEQITPLSAIPQDGVIIGACTVSLETGETAFDALIYAAREKRIRVDYRSSVYGEYISGIGGVSEFGFGDMSGWIYRVNGEMPEVSAGAFALSDGDKVEFIYTCRYGDTAGFETEGIQ
ncbi:MAG: DUF4430 domain-containing protein [Oscillospiraceae bacterium]|nr:DUF4430 domain-containing protein [Oscillospiraceae bacterium]